MRTSPERSETAAWLDLLYGKCTKDHGDIVVVSEKRNCMVGSVNVSKKLDAIDMMHSNPGSYCKINLMDAKAIHNRGPHAIGGVAEVKTIVSFHLDVDAGKAKKYVSRRHALWALESMPKPPTLVVNSNGENGGFHAYWVLREPHVVNGDRDVIQRQADAWNEHLKLLCGGRLDKTSNLDRVLRCVAVPRCDGGRVVCEYYKAEREYTLAELVV